MAIDPGMIGKAFPDMHMTIDAGRLRFFAKAIGETRPTYTDGDKIPVPPTFLMALELESPDPFAWLAEFGVDLRHVLHGEQRFTYHSVAHAGDELIARPRITDAYSKKGGALDFIVKETAISREDGSPVAALTSVIVVRNPEAKA